MLSQLCKQLNLSLTPDEIQSAIGQAHRQQLSLEQFLNEFLEQEYACRLTKKAQRRIKEARFPRLKTIDSFSFAKAPQLPESKINQLMKGEFIQNAEPVILMGEPGTGKTHLATALGFSAAYSGMSVRFITASQLVNQLVEARDHHNLSRLTQFYQRIQLLIIDELGYLPLSKTDAELLFQVISERNELKSIILTTNLPFSEWTHVFSDKRLCRALIDRVTYKAHIIETGSQSMRLAETLKSYQNNGG